MRPYLLRAPCLAGHRAQARQGLGAGTRLGLHGTCCYEAGWMERRTAPLNLHHTGELTGPFPGRRRRDDLAEVQVRGASWPDPVHRRPAQRRAFCTIQPLAPFAAPLNIQHYINRTTSGAAITVNAPPSTIVKLAITPFGTPRS